MQRADRSDREVEDAIEAAEVRGGLEAGVLQIEPLPLY